VLVPRCCEAKRWAIANSFPRFGCVCLLGMLDDMDEWVRDRIGKGYRFASNLLFMAENQSDPFLFAH
jgi:hypothetical protein